MPNRAKLTSMNVALRKPWTQEQFFTWADAQEARYEFDGFQPVAMTGGFNGASAIGIQSDGTSLERQIARFRLPSRWVRTLGLRQSTTPFATPMPSSPVRKLDLDGRKVPGVVVVFEVDRAYCRCQSARPYRQGPRICRRAVHPALRHPRIVQRRADGDGTLLPRSSLASHRPHHRRYPPHARNRHRDPCGRDLRGHRVRRHRRC